MLYFNSCPRCTTGTVQLESDLYGSYLSCLNCGFEKSATSVRKLDYSEELQREVGQSAVETVVAVVEDEPSDDDDFEDDLDADEEDLVELEQAVG